ncbi:MAG: CHAT domain-containing protein [Desulfobacterales bacterium]|nr:CHAT domain-containing protein [Desulfobacterales bacterium]
MKVEIRIQETPYSDSFRDRTEFVSLPRLEELYLQLFRNINENNKLRGSDDITDELKRAGQELYESLPYSIREQLSETTAKYLVLEIDEHLAHIPWELLYIKKQFLCQLFSMGRILVTRQKRKACEMREMKSPLNMWVLANPRGDLEKAGSEGTEIQRNIDRINSDKFLMYVDLDSRISSEGIRKKIRQYDIVHFAGHFDYNARNPEQSGWRLTRGSLSAKDIKEIVGPEPMPALIFSNACQSARTEKMRWKSDGEDKSFGLLNSFISGGVRHYLGTSWEITDEPGSSFATLFYEHLLLGKTIGEAVKLSRLELTGNKKSDVSWASYVLYGDPTVSYFGQNEVENLIKLTLTKGDSESETAKPAPIGQSESGRSMNLRIEHLIMISLIFLLSLFGVIIFGTTQNNSHIEHNQLEYKIRRLELPSDTSEFIIKRGHERHDEITRLINELEKVYNNTIKAPKPEKSSYDGWTSMPLVIAVLFDPERNFANKDEDIFIASVIERQIIKHPRFTLVERMSLDKLLKELIYSGSEVFDPEKRLVPKLLSANLILSIKIVRYKSQAFVLMHMAETEKGSAVGVYIEPLEDFSFKLGQREKLTEDLLKELGERYPLQGKILNVIEDETLMNIGENVGVKMGQQFQVVDKNIILEVVALADGTCTVRVEKGGMPLEKGWRVKRHD